MKKILLIGIPILIAAILLAGIICWIFFFQYARVPTGTMANTIISGDHILGMRKFKNVNRGDLIVFKYPKDLSVQYVKRVIGLPGETIQIKGNRVYINGEELKEQRIAARLHVKADGDIDSEAPLDVERIENKVEGAEYSIFVE